MLVENSHDTVRLPAAGSRPLRYPRPMRRGWLRRNRPRTLWENPGGFTFFAKRSDSLLPQQRDVRSGGVCGAGRRDALCGSIQAGGCRLRGACISLV